MATPAMRLPLARGAPVLLLVVAMAALGCRDGGEEPPPSSVPDGAARSAARPSHPTGSGAPRSGGPDPAFMPPPAHAPGGDPYVAAVQEERRQKDEYFRVSPESPVPAVDRGHFPPLDYYPVDPSWRITLALEPYPKPQTFELVTNLGERRVFRREAQVRFTRDGSAVSLQLYREIEPSGESATLWVPFTDAAAGRETYPAGRYMDVTPDADGRVTLDFNRAYNPYCAYGWAFSCPMAPPENRMKIAVPAGERGFHRP